MGERTDIVTEMAEDRVLFSRAYRTGRWVLGGLVAAYALSTLLPADSRPSWLDTWFYGVVILAVTVSGLVRPLLVRRDRLAWLLLSLATIAWAVGDQYWSIMFADAEEIPIPSPADAGYVALYPLAYVGLILLARSVLRQVPASVLLDGLVTSLGVGALFSAFTLEQILSGVDGSAAEVLTNLSYPIGDLVLIVVAVAALAVTRWWPDPVWWLLAVGFGVFAVADTAYLLGVDSWYDDGSWVDALWLIGIALVPLVSEAGVPPSAVQLELAEDLLLIDPSRTRRALTQFRTLGFRLALDHYGRTAPSLTRLRAMPVQELNLDRSFTASVLHSAPDETVVRSTIMLARSLGIRTLADGIDTPDLLNRVRSYGVSAVQGAAVGRPMAPPELADWLGTAAPARAPQPIG
jgi:hypothetical protein